MSQLHEENVDGLRTFWVASGRPTVTATLCFRVGMADESMARSGWVHLLEHMALHGRQRGGLQVNGSVGPLLTTLSLHGPEELVFRALSELTAWLARPDLTDLERERRVLAVEAAGRGGPTIRAFGMRYGARGAGLVANSDAGLGRATPEALTTLAQRVFAVGNATLALDGPPPEGLRLSLPAGPRLPAPPAEQVEPTPAAYPEPGGLLMTGVVSRSRDNTMLAPVLEDALRRKFRDGDGAAYSPYSFYEAVDATTALVGAGTDVSPSAAATLLDGVLNLLHDLGRHGPDVAAFDDLRSLMRQAYLDPLNVGALSHRAAAMTLHDMPVQDLDELVAELDMADPESLLPSLEQFRDSLLVGAPPSTAPSAMLRVVAQPSSPGTRRGGVVSVDWPADPSRLLVNDREVVVGDGSAVRRYALADLAGYLTWDDGARHLVRTDGWGFTILPDVWSRGLDQVRRLDAAVDADLHLPQPSDTSPTSEHTRHSFARRWAGGLRRWIATSSLARLLVTVFVMALCVGVLAVAVDSRGVSALAPAAAVLVGMWLVRKNQAPR